MSKGDHHHLRHRGLIDLALDHQFNLESILANLCTECTLTIEFSLNSKYYGLLPSFGGLRLNILVGSHSLQSVTTYGWATLGSVASSSKTNNFCHDFLFSACLKTLRPSPLIALGYKVSGKRQFLNYSFSRTFYLHVVLS